MAQHEIEFEAQLGTLADLLDLIETLPRYVKSLRVSEERVVMLLCGEGKRKSFLAAEVCGLGRQLRFDGGVAHFDRA